MKTEDYTIFILSFLGVLFNSYISVRLHLEAQVTTGSAASLMTVALVAGFVTVLFELPALISTSSGLALWKKIGLLALGWFAAYLVATPNY